MREYPKCKKCHKITERIGTCWNGDKIFGCKTPDECGWKEYIQESVSEGKQ